MEFRHSKCAQARRSPPYDGYQAAAPALAPGSLDRTVREQSTHGTGNTAEEQRQTTDPLRLGIIHLELVLQIFRQEGEVEVKAEADTKRDEAKRQDVR